MFFYQILTHGDKTLVISYKMLHDGWIKNFCKKGLTGLQIKWRDFHIISDM